ncbi:hypothetical protein KXV81_001948 [Aspergillus fumigatus]|nr:hypothetical protein KXX26_007936 [Aspergillus fumigatus]KAH2347051.1 hypothetical protein KXV29_005622 [Aspergillus fumigatus]KAH3413154.1 hypothetical protein KXV81_001948 [Aspergillus fumigatus]KAJ8186890.1 hypothetical protein LV161_005348 [Aspergillus fumigatus]KAJ8220280.1 hypothetical protein LV158_001280 [Aspergillus fumigatus]
MSTYHDTFSERDALLAALQKQTDLLNAHPEEADIISKAMNDIEEKLAALGQEESQDLQAGLSPVLETFTNPQLQTDGFSCPLSPGEDADDSDSNTDMDDSDSNEDELNDHLRERFCSHECDHESCRLANEHCNIILMASATGVPQEHPQTIEAREDEPLLGRPGAVTQRESDPIYRNLIKGTAAIAQCGILLLTALVWAGVFSHPLIFFSAHPLLNSSAILLQVQAALILQPTATPQQKLLGTQIHYSLQAISLAAFLTAFTIIEINKGDHPRLTSLHGILGLITYICIILQALLGLVQYFFPVKILGSADAGKRLYKYHRHFGYLLLVLELATVSAATQTTYNVAVLHMPLWGVLVAAVLIVAGVGARIKKHKLGF